MQTDLFRTVQVLDKELVHGTIWFDGGTSCNVPARGYGLGYGSFQIDKRPIRRVKFQRPMSANAAEIGTLAIAVDEASWLKINSLLIIGDSQIALKWAEITAGNREWPKKHTGSDEFRKSIMDLSAVMVRIKKVQTDWRPREQLVERFGH